MYILKRIHFMVVYLYLFLSNSKRRLLSLYFNLKLTGLLNLRNCCSFPPGDVTS